ncbi:UNVERIFIED_CONTAM: hypothetical protein Sindi_0466400, partial [Sesamum indicum]
MYCLDTACRTLRLMNSQTNTWLCTQCHRQQKKPSFLGEHFEAVEEEDEKAIGCSDASSASELSEDEHENTKVKSKMKVQAP